MCSSDLNLLPLGWKFSSSCVYLLSFLIFGSLSYISLVHECLLWFLTAWLGAWDPIVHFDHCDLIWAMLCVLGIPGLWHSLGSQLNFPYWASFWLIDFGRLGLSFSLWNFKAFSLHVSLDPNSLDFFHPFFFFFSLQDGPMCYFSLGLGLWSILNLNNMITK